MSFHFKHQLEEDNARLEKENKALVELIYKGRGLLNARTSIEAYEIWEEIEEKLKQIKEGE